MNLVERVKGIIVSPKMEWPVIAGESGDTGYLFGNYVAILAAIPAVCGFIGLHLFGISVPGIGTLRMTIRSELLWAGFTYLFSLFAIAIWTLAVQYLAPPFGGRRNIVGAVKLAAYVPTPYWLAGIVALYPRAALLQPLFGLYALVLMWTGLPWLMRVPSPGIRSIAYVAAAAVAAMALFALAARGPWVLAGPSGVL